MNKNTSQAFVGLRSYKESEKNIYFGRDQEVESLLLILQKYKLLILTGSSGSGKTSLINAGLIPRLKDGFKGQSGREWSIAFFRPGISPVENFAQALSSPQVLKIDSKPNTTDYDHYKHLIELNGSMGLVEIYRQSEIFNKKNLLVVIDQLEDLFKYKNFFNSLESEEDDKMMDLVYRSVSHKNTSIYFVLATQTSFLSKLTSYPRLQEIISPSQHAIQNIDYEDINKILDQTFYKKGVQFDNQVIDHFRDVLNDDLSYLPNLQHLLYKLYQTYVIENGVHQILNLNDIEEFGAVKQSISKDFENVYQSYDKEQQLRIARFFKSIVNHEDPLKKNQYESIGNIAQYMNLSISELSPLIKNVKTKFLEAFEVFKPLITGTPIILDKAYDQKLILNVKYDKYFNWDRRLHWLKEEESDYEKFSLFSNDAIRKINGEGGLLKTPALETALAWKNNLEHNKNWASKYKINFPNTIKYINDSEEDDKNIKLAKEKQRLREKENEKNKRRWFAIGGSICLVLALISFGFYAFAEIKRKEAYEAKEFAEEKQIEADSERIKAYEAKEFAEEKQIEADSAKIEAEKNFKIADSTKRVALSQKEFILSQKSDIQKQLWAINELNTNLTESQNELVKTEKDKREIAALKNMKYKYKGLNTDLYEAIKEKNKDKILKIAEKSFKLDKELDSLRNLQKGENIAEIFEESAETKELLVASLEDKESYSESSMRLANMKNGSIRGFDISKSLIAFAGDSGKVNFYDDKNQSAASDSIVVTSDIDDRVRKLKFINSEELLLVTFSGKLIKVNRKSKESKTIYQINSTKKTTNFKVVNLHVDKKNDQQILVFNNRIVSVKAGKFSQEDTKFNNVLASFYYNEKLLIATDKGVYVKSKDNSYSKINTNMSGKVSLISVKDNYLFIGMNSGDVCVYQFRNNDLKNSYKKYTFKNHISAVTSIYLDSETKKLYTASKDQSIFKYDITLNDQKKILNSAIELKGHKKWIWDMSTFINNKGQKLLLTADEEGNLLSWYTNPDDIDEKIKDLYDNSNNNN